MPSYAPAFTQQNVGLPISAGGAVSDGVTDDTAAVQAVLNSLAGTGGTALFPIGRQTVISGGLVSLSIPPKCGIGSLAVGPFDAASIAAGVAPIVLVTQPNVSPFVQASRDSWIQDLLVYYPNQIAPTSAAVPTVYPATVATPANSAGFRCRRCTIANAYAGFSLQGGRHLIEASNVGALSNPFAVDFSHDIITLRNIRCEPFWNTVTGLAYPQTIDTWVGNNQIVGIIKRADELTLEDFFAFHGQVGLQMIDGTDTPAQSYGKGSNVTFDTFSVGIQCKSTNSPGWRFANLGINASTAPISMPAGGATTPALFVAGGSFWGAALVPSNAAAGFMKLTGVDNFNPAGSTKLVGGAPAVPATGVALPNKTGVDCMVLVGGGTITQIAIGGTNTGQTSGWFRVPALQTITLTYTVAPTTFAWFGD